MNRLPLAGLLLTFAAVLVLGGSLLAGLGGGPPASSPAPESPARPAGPRVRVEVLNGGGVAGRARQATRRLRNAGLDVVYFGNAGGAARDSSLVLSRGADPGGAQRAARALGIGRVVARPDSALYVDATVVLGRDWTP